MAIKALYISKNKPNRYYLTCTRSSYFYLLNKYSFIDDILDL